MTPYLILGLLIVGSVLLSWGAQLLANWIDRRRSR